MPLFQQRSSSRTWLRAAAITLALCLAACSLPDPPQPAAPRPTTLPHLAISPAPTLDSGATATALARPITPTPPPVAATATPPTATPDTTARYTVQRGDTLAALANRFGTTVEAIVALNNLADPNSIEVGQLLLLPPPAGTTP